MTRGKQYGDRRGRAEGVFRADRVGVGKQDGKRADKTRRDKTEQDKTRQEMERAEANDLTLS